jgi:bifunctional non-homologous end joining protein LigD
MPSSRDSRCQAGGTPAGKAPPVLNVSSRYPPLRGPKQVGGKISKMTADEPFPTGGIVPMLATPSAELPPDDEAWAYELKWDGVRAVAYVDGGRGRLHLESRNLNDVTPRYPEVHALARDCGGRRLVLDGEIVAFDDQGRPSFSRLQPRMHIAEERQVQLRMVDTPVVYLLFDVLHVDGRSTRALPWTERRAVLEGLELAGPNWRVPAAQVGEGQGLLEASRAGGLEGVVAKRLASVYVPARRTREWLKVKNTCRQEFVVGAWLPGAGNRLGRIGALLVGYYDNGALRFAGKVGTGFTDAELRYLAEQVTPLQRDTSPFDDPVPNPDAREARWLEPVLVAEIEFTQWTHTDTLRHPSYKGLRTDKPPEAVVRET